MKKKTECVLNPLYNPIAFSVIGLVFSFSAGMAFFALDTASDRSAVVTMDGSVCYDHPKLLSLAPTL